MCSAPKQTAQPLEVAPREALPPHILPRIRAELAAHGELSDRLWSLLQGRELDLTRSPDRSLLLAYGHLEKALIGLEEALRASEALVRAQSPRGGVSVS